MEPQPVNPLESAEYDYLSASTRTLLLYCLCEAQFKQNKKFAVHLRKDYEVHEHALSTICEAGKVHAIVRLFRVRCGKKLWARTPQGRSVPEKSSA